MLCVVRDQPVEGVLAEPVVAVSLEHTPTWTVAWNHSVTGILVRDFYTFEADTMTLVGSHAPSFDAGLGHIPGRGRVVSDANHGYWIMDINEPVPGNHYLLRVGSERVNHRIIHEDITYSLSDVAAGERVQIFVAEDCLEPSTSDE
jgi:hypothetical protein